MNEHRAGPDAGHFFVRETMNAYYPSWKCLKCGGVFFTHERPAPDAKVRFDESARKSRVRSAVGTCDEYVVFQLLTS